MKKPAIEYCAICEAECTNYGSLCAHMMDTHNRLIDPFDIVRAADARRDRFEALEVL